MWGYLDTNNCMACTPNTSSSDGKCPKSEAELLAIFEKVQAQFLDRAIFESHCSQVLSRGLLFGDEGNIPLVGDAAYILRDHIPMSIRMPNPCNAQSQSILR